jgi:hypothetical protein
MIWDADISESITEIHSSVNAAAHNSGFFAACRRHMGITG